MKFDVAEQVSRKILSSKGELLYDSRSVKPH